MTYGGIVRLVYAGGSHPGQRRTANEDSAFASPRLLAVADGMGGHVHGEVACTEAVKALSELDTRLAAPYETGCGPGRPTPALAEHPPADSPIAGPERRDAVELLGACITDVFMRLCELGLRQPKLMGMGTTLTALVVEGDRLGVGHIGDSRAYLLSDGSLRHITRDHTFVQSLVDQGHLTPAQAAEHPRRSMVVRALQSGGPLPEPDLFFHRIAPGDRLLVCSDGLTDVLADETLSAALATQAEPADAVRQLIDLANRAGGPDNITCLVADVLPDDHRDTDAMQRTENSNSAGSGGTGGRLVLGAAAERLGHDGLGHGVPGHGRLGRDGLDHDGHGHDGPGHDGPDPAQVSGSTAPPRIEHHRDGRRWRLPRWARKPWQKRANDAG